MSEADLGEGPGMACALPFWEKSWSIFKNNPLLDTRIWMVPPPSKGKSVRCPSKFLDPPLNVSYLYFTNKKT